MRYTSQFIETRFKRFCEELGLNCGPDDKAVIGACRLDHTPLYGGWEIQQICNEQGGITVLNGWCNRMSAKELMSFMDGARLAKHLLELREVA